MFVFGVSGLRTLLSLPLRKKAVSRSLRFACASSYLFVLLTIPFLKTKILCVCATLLCHIGLCVLIADL